MYKKSFDGKFAPGKPLGTRQGVMKHDASTSAVKDRLHNDLNPSRSPVTAHAGVASVNTDGGTKPRAHDCDDCGPNAAANEEFNQAAQGPREGGYFGNKTGGR